MTYLNEKSDKYVRPLADEVQASIYMPLDVQNPEQMGDLFYRVQQQWGKLDFLIHAIAFAPMKDLHGRFVDTTPEGFSQAMDISCHSLVRMAHHAEPLMTDGGCILTTTYFGSEKVVDHYGIMGPVKAALECSVKYLAAELGPKGIRVSAMSPGPVKTRAGSGIKDFNTLLDNAQQKAPGIGLVSIEDVGSMAVFLVSDEAKSITGATEHIDGGYNIIG
jgi:enoyl-[acyl-carrier protein] reductase I